MKTLVRVCRIIFIALLVICVSMSPAFASTADRETEQAELSNCTSVIYGWHRVIMESLYSYFNCIDIEPLNLPSPDTFDLISQDKEEWDETALYQDDQSDLPDVNDSATSNINNDPVPTYHFNEPASSEDLFVAEVIRLVNAERIAEGLSPLTESTLLDQAAAVRCGEITNVFSHTRPDGSSCFTAMQEAGALYSRAGENIAIGQSSPAQVVRAWMDSPGHRANIMNGEFRYIGVSVRPSNDGYGGYAWVQVFTD